jgi:hypothetical protein
VLQVVVDRTTIVIFKSLRWSSVLLSLQKAGAEEASVAVFDGTTDIGVIQARDSCRAEESAVE